MRMKEIFSVSEYVKGEKGRNKCSARQVKSDVTLWERSERNANPLTRLLTCAYESSNGKESERVGVSEKLKEQREERK